MYYGFNIFLGIVTFLMFLPILNKIPSDFWVFCNLIGGGVELLRWIININCLGFRAYIYWFVFEVSSRQGLIMLGIITNEPSNVNSKLIVFDGHFSFLCRCFHILMALSHPSRPLLSSLYFKKAYLPWVLAFSSLAILCLPISPFCLFLQWYGLKILCILLLVNLGEAHRRAYFSGREDSLN